MSLPNTIAETKTEVKPIWQLKEHLKELSKLIRTSKYELKSEQRKQSSFYNERGIDFVTKFPWTGGDSTWYRSETPPYTFEAKKDKLKRNFRCMHIAYCLLRGKERSQIENPKDDNQPNEILIRRTLDEYSC